MIFVLVQVNTDILAELELSPEENAQLLQDARGVAQKALRISPASLEDIAGCIPSYVTTKGLIKAIAKCINSRLCTFIAFHRSWGFRVSRTNFFPVAVLNCLLC